MNAVSANRLELIQIADAVAREKSIEKSLVIEAMEDALARAARSRYGHETNVRAEINPKTGETRLWRLLEAVETVENDSTQISLEEARHRNPAANVGDFISEPLPPIEFGRVAAMAAKQVITQKVREAERDRQYEDFKDKVGEIVSSSGSNPATSSSISPRPKPSSAATSSSRARPIAPATGCGPM